MLYVIRGSLQRFGLNVSRGRAYFSTFYCVHCYALCLRHRSSPKRANRRGWGSHAVGEVVRGDVGQGLAEDFVGGADRSVQPFDVAGFHERVFRGGERLEAGLLRAKDLLRVAVVLDGRGDLVLDRLVGGEKVLLVALDFSLAGLLEGVGESFLRHHGTFGDDVFDGLGGLGIGDIAHRFVVWWFMQFVFVVKSRVSCITTHATEVWSLRIIRPSPRGGLTRGAFHRGGAEPR